MKRRPKDKALFFTLGLYYRSARSGLVPVICLSIGMNEKEFSQEPKE